MLKKLWKPTAQGQKQLQTSGPTKSTRKLIYIYIYIYMCYEYMYVYIYIYMLRVDVYREREITNIYTYIYIYIYICLACEEIYRTYDKQQALIVQTRNVIMSASACSA